MLVTHKDRSSLTAVLLLASLGSLLLLACDQNSGTSPSGKKPPPTFNEHPDPDPKAAELKRIALHVARSEFMRPVVLALYDPDTKSLHEPKGTSLYDQMMASKLTSDQAVEFVANRDRIARQLAENRPWMQWALEKILRESGKEPTNSWKMLLLQGPKCGLSEDESRLFVEGR